jgi:dihydroneopterin aldolase
LKLAQRCRFAPRRARHRNVSVRTLRETPPALQAFFGDFLSPDKKLPAANGSGSFILHKTQKANTKMDTVFIEDLRIETVIGIYDWERKIKQTIALDIEMAFDNRKPAMTDKIDDTLDYKAVSKRLITFVEAAHFELVETLAERCAEIIREEFHVSWLRLKLSKLGAVTGSKAVGVIIERGQTPQ